MNLRQTFRALTLAIALGPLCAAIWPPTEGHASAAILVDADSGKVLYAENATYPWYPASVTKLMTLYLTLRAVKEHRITLDTLFTVSRNAAAQDPSKMGFAVGTQITVDNVIKMLMVHSANDMAVVLAEGVDGSIENFSEDMTRTAHSLGMTESHFVNPNGLPADGQITSARDLAILARALIHDFPEYDHYWHIGAIKLGRRVMRNTNSLLGRFPGIDGMKTGFICAAGYNLVATATRNGRRLIAVVLGAPSSAVRAVKAAELLEGGFSQNALSWLTPALGSVEALTPVNASPPNLHDEICGSHRKRQKSEDEEGAGSEDNTEAGSPFSAILSSLRAPTRKGAALLTDPAPVVPVVVYTGPTRTPAEIAKLAALPEASVHHHKKRSAAKAAKTAKAAAVKVAPDGRRPTDHVSRRKTAAGAWTPTSAAPLAANPPSTLAKKPHAASAKRHAKPKSE